MSYLKEKVGTTPYTPIEHLRLAADNLEKFWGPVSSQFGLNRHKHAEPDDPFMKAALDDAKCLRMTADILEKNLGASP